MPFSPFIAPIGTEPEKDHWLQERAEDILPARDYFNGEVFNLAPNMRPDSPSIRIPPQRRKIRGKALGQAIGPAGTWGPVVLIAGAAALAFLFLKKK
jgi:hypothetical protein